MSLLEKIKRIAEKNKKGFTVHTYGLDRPINGFCVAYIDTQNCHDDEGLKKAIAHAQVHSQVLGGWYHEEGKKFYYDSVRVFHTKQAAIEAAIRERQIGYYDLKNGYVPMMDDGMNLLHPYQSMLMAWNRNRKKKGLQPFQILK